MKRKLIIGTLIVMALMMALVAAVREKRQEMEKVAQYDRDVTWLKAGGTELKVDVSRPEGKGPFPVVVWFHGGGWKKYSKESNEGLARYVTNRGYVVMNFNYRMAPDYKMKTIIEDAMGALIWAKDNAAKYYGDPTRIAVAGHSAGGHLAAMVASACGDPFFTPSCQSKQGNDCKVTVSVPVSGVYDFTATGKNGRGERMDDIFGATPDQDPELYKKCSPLTYIRKNLPPQLVVYAEKEPLRKHEEKWIAALQSAGAPVESYMQPNVNHLWVTWHNTKAAQQTYDRIVKFLDETLKK
jgi:acetyl esterase